MTKQAVLVAATEIRGGHRRDANDPTSITAHVAAPGTVLTASEISKLGLNADEVTSLQTRGAIVEQQALVTGSTGADGESVVGSTGTLFKTKSLDQMHKMLDAAKVNYPKDAGPADLIKLALAHQLQPATPPAPPPAPTPPTPPADR